MNDLIKRILLALATGYMLFFFSELVFWSFWRPTDTIGGYAITWILGYSIPAYIFLLIVHEFRARNVWALFLCGAAFGWLVEGVVAMTFFGAETPFPLTISWTGLGWHALISVLLGWYCTQLLLGRGRISRMLLFAAGLGLFWGFWAHTWTLETPPIVTSIPEFAMFAFTITFLFIVSHMAYRRLAAGPFQPAKAEKIALSLIAALFFAFITVPAQPILAPAILLPLLGLLYLGLRKNRLREIKPGLIRIVKGPIPFKHYISLFVMPAVATAAYCLFFPLASILWPNFIVFTVSTLLGFSFLCFSLYRMFRPKSLPKVAARGAA